MDRGRKGYGGGKGTTVSEVVFFLKNKFGLSVMVLSFWWLGMIFLFFNYTISYFVPYLKQFSLCFFCIKFRCSLNESEDYNSSLPSIKVLLGLNIYLIRLYIIKKLCT